jgi:hypothetical protein
MRAAENGSRTHTLVEARKAVKNTVTRALPVVLRRPCTSFLFLRKLSKTARVKLRLPGGIESEDLRSNVPASPAVPVAGLAC